MVVVLATVRTVRGETERWCCAVVGCCEGSEEVEVGGDALLLWAAVGTAEV